jgi:hypothetical protein
MNFTFLRATGAVAFFRSDAEQAEWTEEEMSLLCTFPYLKNKNIERGMTVLFQDPATSEWQAYYIRNCASYAGEAYQQFTAENLAITELTGCHIGNDIELTEITPAYALGTILNGTGWSVGSDYAGSVVSSGDIGRGSVWQGVGNICSNWNVHIVPRVTVNMYGIVGRYLDIIPGEGIFRGMRISVDKNTADPCITYDDSELYTALYGYGASYSEGEGEERKTLETNFADVVWAKTDDHPAKPAGQMYLEYPEMTAIYGINGRARFDYYQNSDIKDPEVLLQKTWESLKIHCQPKISFNGTVTDLKRFGYADTPLRLYDMAIVELKPFGILLYKQIVKLNVNLLDPTGNTATIGDYIPNIIYINRETEDFATGGGKGVKGTRSRKKQGEFETNIRQNERLIDLNAKQVDTQGNILQQAGMKIDPITGVLIYAEDNQNMVGSKFRVVNNKIESEVEERKSENHTLSSRITQNSNSIQLEVSERRSADSSLSSRITETANSIQLEVNRATAEEGRLSGRINVQADKISLVVTERDGQNHINAAGITLSINNSSSAVAINADHVKITGDTLLSGQLTVSDGALMVKTALLVSGSTNGNVSINNGSINAKTHQINSGGSVKWIGGNTGEYYDITTEILKGMVKQFSVSGNTLTLTPFYGDPVNFSKATTLNGSWGSGTGGEIRYRVVASPQGNANYATVFVENGIASKNTNWQTMVDIPVKIRSYVNGSETAVDTGYENTLHVNVSDLLQDKTGTNKITSNGTYTPDSDHIGFGSIEIAVPTGHMDVKTQFNSSPDGYYIVSTDGSGGPEIANSSSYYQLGTSGSNASTKVQVQNTSGTRIGNTPELSVGSLYTNGQNSVNIIKGSWDTTNARIQFSKSAGTANTQGVQVGASGSWSNGNFSAPIKDYYDNPAGVDTGYTVSTDIGSPSTSNPSAQPSTASIAGRTQVGTSGISKAGLSGPGYIFFSVTVRGRELKYYITVNP